MSKSVDSGIQTDSRSTAAAPRRHGTQRTLTRREIECLRLLAIGKSNAGIAEELHISLPTVAMHLHNARVKLGAATREHAIAIVVSSGIVSL